MKGYKTGRGSRIPTIGTPDGPPDVHANMEYVVSPMGKDWRMRDAANTAASQPKDVGEPVTPRRTIPQEQPQSD